MHRGSGDHARAAAVHAAGAQPVLDRLEADLSGLVRTWRLPHVSLRDGGPQAVATREDRRRAVTRPRPISRGRARLGGGAAATGPPTSPLRAPDAMPELLARAAFPVVLTLLVTRPSWLLLLGVAVWVLGADLFHAGLRWQQAAAEQRPGALVRVLVRAPVFLALAATLVNARPWLLAVLMLGVAASATLARMPEHGRRSAPQDLFLSVVCGVGVYAMWSTGVPQPPGTLLPANAPFEVWVVAVTCTLVLIGSTLHLNAVLLVRQRVWHRASQAYAAVCAAATCLVAAAAATGQQDASLVWLVLPALLLAERTWVLAPGSAWADRLGSVGLVRVEGGVFVVVALGVALALHA